MNGKYYVGCTSNLAQRIEFHNNGFVRSTKAHRPWQLIYQEKFDDLKSARERESQIKSWKKRSAIESLIKRGISLMAE